MRCLSALLLLVATAQATILTLQSPRIVVSDSTGNQLRSEPISTTQKAQAVELGKKDQFKLTFQIVDKEDGKGIQPHQAFLRFYDEFSEEEGIQPIRVATNGKAKFELNMAKPPLSIPATKAGIPLKVSLFVGTANYAPTSLRLPDLMLPPSAPITPHPDEFLFHPRPEIHHTFREEQKLPPRQISAAFSAILGVPWLVLLSLWSQVSIRTPNLFSPKIIPFVATLGAFEALLVWYWVELRLGQVLLYGAGLAVVTVFTGKSALATIASQRTNQK